MDVRLLLAIGGGLVALGALAYVAYRWQQLKSWASNWLAAHPQFKKVVCNARFLAEEAAAAAKRGYNKIRLPAEAVDRHGSRKKIVSTEEISLDQIDKYIKKAKEESTLAC